MKLGTYIKTFRRKQKTYQKDLALRIMITPQYLNDLENNRREPSDSVLQKLSDALGFDLDFGYLLIGKLPPDLRGTPTKDKMAKAYKIMRGNSKSPVRAVKPLESNPDEGE